MIPLRHGIIQSSKGVVTVADSISLSYTFLDFDYYGYPCITDTIEVTSSGPWTASWSYSGIYFDADKYSGISGNLVTIYCYYINYFSEVYYDTLVFQCGTATANLDIVQYVYEMGCA